MSLDHAALRPLLDASCPLPLDAPFTRAGAEALGVSRQQLRTLCRRGLVRAVLRDVYAAAQAPDDLDFRIAALKLVINPGAVVTDRTAAWLHGIDVLQRGAHLVTPPVAVFQKPGTRVRREHVDSGERRLAPEDLVEIGGLCVTSRARTACDLGRLLWRYDALGALDAFLRAGTPHDEILLMVPRFKGYRWVTQLKALVPLATPKAESMPESALRLHWYDAGLPTPVPQWPVEDDAGREIYRLDIAAPDELFGGEYNGVEFHGPDRAPYDERRALWLADAQGWHLEVFVNDDLYRPGADASARLRVTRRQWLRERDSRPTFPTL